MAASDLRRHPVSRRNFLLGAAAAAAVAASEMRRSGIGRTPRTHRWRWGPAVGFGSDPSSQLRLFGPALPQPRPNQGVRRPRSHAGSAPPSTPRSATSSARSRQQWRNPGGRAVLRPRPSGRTAPETPHFYRWRTDDGWVSECPATTAMPPAETPGLVPLHDDRGPGYRRNAKPSAGSRAGDYDDKYYKADNDRRQSHGQRAEPDSPPAQTSTSWPVTSRTPIRRAPASPHVRAKRQSPTGFDKYNPFVWDGYLAAIEPSARRAVDVRHRQPRHGGAYRNHGYGGHPNGWIPENGPAGCPSVYSFTLRQRGGALPRRQRVSYEITANTGIRDGAQNSWVERTLAGIGRTRTSISSSAFFHHCAYSTEPDCARQ